MRTQNLQQILNSTFKRKQKSHPSYSKAALARDLGVSPTFISSIFSGKKLPPKDKVEKMAYLLEMDNHERTLFFKMVLLPESLPDTVQSLVRHPGLVFVQRFDEPLEKNFSMRTRAKASGLGPKSMPPLFVISKGRANFSSAGA